MQAWSAFELETLALGHQRRLHRAQQILEDWSQRPGASIPDACGTAAKTKAAYRFLGSKFVEADALRDAQAEATAKRIAEQRDSGQKRLLVAQDTTSLDFTSHKATRGLGMLDNPVCQGLLMHSGLALTERGVPLGVLHQQVWVRDQKIDKAVGGRAAQSRRKPTAEKESQRWLDTVTACKNRLPSGVEVIVVGDREADIFDLFALPRSPHIHLLVRAAHQRRVRAVEPASGRNEHIGHELLWDSVRSSPLRGMMTIEVQRANQGATHRAARQAELELRFRELELLPPLNGKGPDGKTRSRKAEGVTVTAVLVEEKQPPAGTAPLCWLLLTTVVVTTIEEAQQCVHWYNQRWKVERYHYVLKSGCGVEELQLETRERLERALALYCIVAWRLLWLTYQARETPEEPCTLVLEEDAWKALTITMEKGRPPQQPPSLRQAVRWIAQLGGFLGRKGDGEPGVKVLWRGLQRLHDITETYKILTQVLGNG